MQQSQQLRAMNVAAGETSRVGEPLQRRGIAARPSNRFAIDVERIVIV
jgi:hypothetical protein